VAFRSWSFASAVPGSMTHLVANRPALTLPDERIEDKASPAIGL
ncbi:hypothetical protein Tco_1409770, partial [Tanacetum coccineum]